MTRTKLHIIVLAVLLVGSAGTAWFAQASLPPQPPKPTVIELPADDPDALENSDDPVIQAAIERGRELERQDIEDEQAVQDEEDSHRYDGVRGY
jgi:hypothetical protein